MDELVVTAGDVIVTDFSGYQHWSLVTDRFCVNGKPMLISATKRNGTVQEESWDIVTQGKPTYVAEISFRKPIIEVLSAARSQIGKWSYSITCRNCEHFVKWATGLEVSSAQVNAGVGGAALGVSLVGLFAENPKLIKFLAGAVVIGGIAVATTKAVERRRVTNPAGLKRGRLG